MVIIYFFFYIKSSLLLRNVNCEGNYLYSIIYYLVIIFIILKERTRYQYFRHFLFLTSICNTLDSKHLSNNKFYFIFYC